MGEISELNAVAKDGSCAVVTTAVTHPVRAFLNCASMYSSPIATIKARLPHVASGFGVNVFRGGLGVGCASLVNRKVHSHAGVIAGISAAALVGTTVATLVETTLIRKNNFTTKQYFKFSPVLTSAYFLREMGFSIGVFGSKGMSEYKKIAMTASVAWLTAGFHKIATIAATADLLAPEHTVPNFKRESLAKIANNVMTGNVYGHPGFRVPFQQPSHSLQRVANGLFVFCGPNMFFWRMSLIYAYGKVFHQAMDAYPAVTSVLSNSLFRQSAVIPENAVGINPGPTRRQP